ncbi:MAG: hypothetical protein ACN6I3_00560 [bacterium]
MYPVFEYANSASFTAKKGPRHQSLSVLGEFTAVFLPRQTTETAPEPLKRLLPFRPSGAETRFIPRGQQRRSPPMPQLQTAAKQGLESQFSSGSQLVHESTKHDFSTQNTQKRRKIALKSAEIEKNGHCTI